MLSNEKLAYLAMRAKKMTARMSAIPSPEVLLENFKRKGTEISLGTAQRLIVEVEKHRAMNWTISPQLADTRREAVVPTIPAEKPIERRYGVL